MLTKEQRKEYFDVFLNKIVDWDTNDYSDIIEVINQNVDNILS